MRTVPLPPAAVTARFKRAVQTMAPERKRALLGSLEQWQLTEEAKEFWNRRHDSDSRSVTTTTSTTIAASIITTTTTSSTVTEQSLRELEIFFSENLRRPPVGSRLVVNGTDVTYSFYVFQQHVRQVLHVGRLAYESHMHHILALSSIMLLYTGVSTSMEVCRLDEQCLLGIFNDVSSSTQFSRVLLIQALDVIQEAATDGSLSRKTASFKLLALTFSDCSFAEQGILLYLQRALLTLPKDRLLSASDDEVDLCSRLLLPLLQSLFDDRESPEEVFFKLNNSKNHECELVPQLRLSERRPDGVIKRVVGSQQQTIGFMEAKPLAMASNTKKINIDLVRLGMMGKNAIDVHGLKSVLLRRSL